MGLPRLSLKRCFLYVFCLTGMLLVLMNVRQKEIWHAMRSDPVQVQSLRGLGDTTKSQMKQYWPLKSKKPTIRIMHTIREMIKRKDVTEMNSTGTTILSENSIDSLAPSRRPWYMKGGTRRPYPATKSRRTGRRLARLWPEEDTYDDRVTNQLMFVPPDYNRTDEHRLKKIMVPHGMGEAKVGSDIFVQHRCPVNTCTIVRDNPDEADLILFKDYVTHVGRRPRNQVWMLYFLECPYHTQSVKNALINWTATYRRDSDIVAPYERWQYYDSSVKQISQTFNYAANKTKKVAWFVSNCHPRNQRMHYAKELSKYIQVDIYGACGTLRCPRSQSQTCFDMLDEDYKFYLAFENSNCKDYITEKFFVNGLGHNVLPIVMGAHPNDYAKSAPYRSYIHVDEFESPKELATYLHRLDHDDELYNSYFRWKGTGEFINTYFWCRVCAMLHDDRPAKFYKDVNDWWRGEGVCTTSSWREHESSKKVRLRNT
ncbi:glycoprotein 3-alpha-L-fucosyltransferase A-like isoform X1 [Vespula maculifrons]|uniref:Fucosyltransferase n=1 Tax=Vespula maculifrons TaxID=7453 RepID=A0ABD2B5R1_VESMC|nr:glycoprotein 3-alpha-L-fucosyltransferase A isoform X1 [Vespula pensylvanica]XP_043668655.1 glycoprotein 3-alpha-L-fucosyltransferase A isoform X1 [Vespula pensylvanica]XP_043668656.1 glycoprotein 3-alpha-L-fucosyltransferase A isoform X1 [Vespula pensylvanica]XP_050850715.1 glycoprotein 3-alpha-L-fucosyltransferase A isoform X1 [Vespula vulgaris]XP_050850716.1 glycoprotein 3-alpha-L-fucosyltransferase A isoform X1 [Vespula vulgaris]